MMEVIHHFLVRADEESPGDLDIAEVLRKSVSLFDGGFTVGGFLAMAIHLYSVTRMASARLIIM